MKMSDKDAEKGDDGKTVAAPVTAGAPVAGEPTTDEMQPLFFSETLNVKNPIIFDTQYGALIYDVDARAYWVLYNTTTWLRIHVMPRITITKGEARSFLAKCPRFPHALEELPRRFPSLQLSSKHAMLSPTILCYNAMHDSIIVKRDKASSGLVPFYLDKVKAPLRDALPPVLPMLRPEFTAGCTCPELQTYENLEYCSACTTFRAKGEPLWPVQGQREQPTNRGIQRAVGRLTFEEGVAVAIVGVFCNGTVEGTFETCNMLFPLAGLKTLPIPHEVTVELVLRYSLFAKANNKVITWAELFAPRQRVAGVSETVGLIRLGLAIGTLGTIS